jgi:putative transcriptional regulator
MAGLGTVLSQSVLIAMPQLVDPNFHRSVVLIIEHDQQGTLGLVINHPTEHRCADVAANLQIDWQADPHLTLHRGGPVEPESFWMLHTDAVQAEDTVSVLPGVALSRSRDALAALGTQQEVPMRMIIGYAGWGPGQLEAEIAEGAWLVTAASAEMVFDWAPDLVWRGALSAVGIDPAYLVPGGGSVH